MHDLIGSSRDFKLIINYRLSYSGPLFIDSSHKKRFSSLQKDSTKLKRYFPNSRTCLAILDITFHFIFRLSFCRLSQSIRCIRSLDLTIIVDILSSKRVVIPRSDRIIERFYRVTEMYALHYLCAPVNHATYK